MSPECVRFVKGRFFLNDSGLIIKSNNSTLLNDNYLNLFLFLRQEFIYDYGRSVAQKNLDIEQFSAFKIPLPPKDIQEKIVAEIEVLEAKEAEAKAEIEANKR